MDDAYLAVTASPPPSSSIPMSPTTGQTGQEQRLSLIPDILRPRSRLDLDIRRFDLGHSSLDGSCRRGNLYQRQARFCEATAPNGGDGGRRFDPGGVRKKTLSERNLSSAVDLISGKFKTLSRHKLLLATTRFAKVNKLPRRR
ncbi:hypothetical protein YC2023_075727 [Brassica napus]